MLQLVKALGKYSATTGNIVELKTSSNLVDENGKRQYVFVCGTYDGDVCESVTKVIVSGGTEVLEGHPVAVAQFEKALQDIRDAIEYHETRFAGLRGALRRLIGVK